MERCVRKLEEVVRGGGGFEVIFPTERSYFP